MITDSYMIDDSKIIKHITDSTRRQGFKKLMISDSYKMNFQE
jgi:hypothetical protein